MELYLGGGEMREGGVAETERRRRAEATVRSRGHGNAAILPFTNFLFLSILNWRATLKFFKFLLFLSLSLSKRYLLHCIILLEGDSFA